MTTDAIDTSVDPDPEPNDRPARERRANPLVRLRVYLSEVVSELRKVVWPGRTQLVTYVTVVLVFVTFFVLLVSGLDYVFTQGVLAVFG